MNLIMKDFITPEERLKHVEVPRDCYKMYDAGIYADEVCLVCDRSGQEICSEECIDENCLDSECVQTELGWYCGDGCYGDSRG